MKRIFVTMTVLALTLGACKNVTQQVQEGAEQALNEVEEGAQQALNKVEEGAVQALDKVGETVKETTAIIKEEMMVGVYQGVTPCADCEGIQLELKLNTDKTYELKQTYLGKKETLTDTFKGSYSLENNVIKLDGLKDMSNLFRVEVGQVRYLGADGAEVTGELADNYILKKK